MATMTMTTNVTTGKRNRTKRPVVRLTLSIDGVDYECLPFSDEDDGLSDNEMQTWLKGSSGRWFAVYRKTAVLVNHHFVDPDHRYHCGRCGDGDCQHGRALEGLCFM